MRRIHLSDLMLNLLPQNINRKGAECAKKNNNTSTGMDSNPASKLIQPIIPDPLYKQSRKALREISLRTLRLSGNNFN